MGKTYIDTVKYVVHADVEIDGVVEKPDVVGALFGQTEGLLGDELDLRELQKSGRIGRIEVDIRGTAGKSTGRIILPSSLDRVETAILGAALETVDRVGPCEAKIRIRGIEDTRTVKRDHVVGRAKEILRTMITDVAPESKELSELVRDEVKTAEVGAYGPDKLPCGPNIDEAEHIVVVEGRADVLTMLKCDIKNVIGMMGKNIPQSVIELSHEKTVTIFADGDRGGDLIIKALSELAEVDFVAKAPDGKEVEELTKKEVIKCLRRKIPMEQFISRKFPVNGDSRDRGEFREMRERPERNERPERPERTEMPERAVRTERPQTSERPMARPERTERFAQYELFSYGAPKPAPAVRAAPRPEARPAVRAAPRPEQAVEAPVAEIAPKPAPDALTSTAGQFEQALRDLRGTLKGALFDEKRNMLKEVDVKDIAQAMMETDNVQTVVFDGIVTQRLVDIANQRGVKHLVAMRQSRIDNKGGVNIITS